MTMMRIQQFAKLAGVTVRALRHYDRMGLLSPAQRSQSGYRLYRDEDLGRLERILVLRYLGLSLHEIADLLNAGSQDASSQGATGSLAETLARQSAVLRERRAGIDRMLRIVEQAQAKAAEAADSEWSVYQTILKEIHMQQAQSWTDKYYSPDGLEAIRERRATWTPERQAEFHAQWQELFADVQGAIDGGVEPASEEAGALAARWKELGETFTQGNTELSEGLRRLYSDHENWPQDPVADRLKAGMPNPEHLAFIKQIFIQQSQSWTDKYYSPEGLKAVRERRAAWTPERHAELHAEWQALFAEVQSAIDRGVEPASEEGRALAARWKELGEAFTQGNAELKEGLRRLYSDHQNWPQSPAADRLRAGMPKPEHIAFLFAPANAG